MFFTQSNVEVRLARGAGEARRALFDCGASPVCTLVVNEERCLNIDAFLRGITAIEGIRPLFERAGDERLVTAGGIRVVRGTAVHGADFECFGGWNLIDAFLSADRFDRFVALLDELVSSGF